MALSIVARLAAPELAEARSELSEETAALSLPLAPATGRTLTIRHYEENDSVFVNGEYRVKGVAGRILWTVSQWSGEVSIRGRLPGEDRKGRHPPDADS